MDFAYMNNMRFQLTSLVIFLIFTSYSAYGETIAKQLTVIEKPKPLKRVQPKYPQSAAIREKEGWATFNYTIEADGSVSNIQLEDNFGSKAFIKEAKKAIKKWKYKPALENGKPVQQCVNSVRMDFLMEGEQKISSGFLRTYKKIKAALTEKDFSEALEKLNSFSPNNMNNIRESNYMHTLWIEYAKSINNEKLQLKHLKKITFNDQHESSEYKLSILNQRLQLEIKFSEFVNAKQTYSRIKPLKAAEKYLPEFEKLMRNVDSYVFGSDYILLPADIKNKIYWRHYLARNQFAITDIKGNLHKIDVRCANKRHTYTIEEDNTWKIPTSWKHCSIDIYGDDNATFTLVELPFEGAKVAFKNKQETE